MLWPDAMGKLKKIEAREAISSQDPGWVAGSLFSDVYTEGVGLEEMNIQVPCSVDIPRFHFPLKGQCAAL